MSNAKIKQLIAKNKDGTITEKDVDYILDKYYELEDIIDTIKSMVS